MVLKWPIKAILGAVIGRGGVTRFFHKNAADSLLGVTTGQIQNSKVKRHSNLLLIAESSQSRCSPGEIVRPESTELNPPQKTHNTTWRFMGSYKWGYTSLNMGYNYSYPTYITPFVTTHEPPSRENERVCYA